eukprot:8780456-Pyramimonas_sp.AAC.1
MHCYYYRIKARPFQCYCSTTGILEYRFYTADPTELQYQSTSAVPEFYNHEILLRQRYSMAVTACVGYSQY